jgi:hypothetical protein
MEKNQMVVRSSAALIQDLKEPIGEGCDLIEELNARFKMISDILRDLYHDSQYSTIRHHK